MSRARALLALAIVAYGVASCRDVLGLREPEPPDAAADAAPDGEALDATSDVSDAAVASDAAPDVDAAPAYPTPYWSFVDGFETGDFRYWTQIIDPGTDGSLTVVDAGAHVGCCAMRSTVVAGGARTNPFEYLVASWPDAGAGGFVTSGTIAFRAEAKITSVDQDVGLLSIVQGGSQGTANATGVIAPKGSGAAWGQTLLDPANPSQLGAGGGQLLANGGADGLWHCLELDMVVAASGTLSLFVDPTGSKSLAAATFGTDTRTSPGWDTALLGVLYSSSGAAATTVLWDDVAIGLFADTSKDVHIGCP